jgi:predicted amidohydrolase YtcJ
MPLRLRWYEMSVPVGLRRRIPRGVPGAEDHVIRQVGVKTWTDGSPWIGNIATSFPISTRGHPRPRSGTGAPRRLNYTAEQLHAIAEPSAAAGWQLACHAHGDLAVDETLDVYERLIRTAWSITASGSSTSGR